MEPKRLRAVQPGEIVAPKVREVPTSIGAAVAAGTSRDVLAATRRKLAEAMDAGEVSSNSLASVSKELRELDRLIRLADAQEVAEEEKHGDQGRTRRAFNASAV